MEGKDEIIFTGNYKEFCLGIRFGLAGRSAMDAASALGYVSEKIEPYAFRFSGIDMPAIEGLAAPRGKGIGAVCSFFEGMPPGEFRRRLLAAVPKPELYAAAESYLLNRALSAANVAFRVPSSDSVKPEKEELGDFIGFMGKYGQWVAIKKLGLEGVQEYEVSGILSGINHTVVNKAFDFAGWKPDASTVDEAPKRKSFGSLAQSLRELEGRMSGGPEDALTVCARLAKIGFKPYASPEMLTEAYPDIKPPKVRGRKPKG